MTNKVSQRFKRDFGAVVDIVLSPSSLARGAITANRKNDGKEWDMDGDLSLLRRNTKKSIIRYRASFKRIAGKNKN